VGGSGGTKSFSFFQSSVSPARILPRLMDDNSLVAVLENFDFPGK
jgi:hypothetical protein